MVHQKLVTLSSLVLVLAVIAVNAGGSKRRKNGSKGGPSSDMMSLMAYCLPCESIQSAMDANRACVQQCAPDAVKDAGQQTGDSCWQAMHPKKNGGPKAQMQMSNETKKCLSNCFDTLMKSGGDQLKKCGDDARKAMAANRKASSGS